VVPFNSRRVGVTDI
jgi:hypothetical protein